MFTHCPGAKTFAYPQIIIRSCPNCGKMVHREAPEACIMWCHYAEKCIDDLEKRGTIDKERASELRKIMKK